VAIFDLFSKSQRKLRGEVPDVYQYDVLPPQLRVQVVHIVRDTIGTDRYGRHEAARVYNDIHEVLAKEYGVFTLNEPLILSN